MSVEFDRESPGKFDSRTLSRETLSRWIGRILLLVRLEGGARVLEERPQLHPVHVQEAYELLVLVLLVMLLLMLLLLLWFLLFQEASWVESKVHLYLRRPSLNCAGCRVEPCSTRLRPPRTLSAPWSMPAIQLMLKKPTSLNIIMIITLVILTLIMILIMLRTIMV